MSIYIIPGRAGLLSSSETALIEEIQTAGDELSDLVAKLENTRGLDPRWIEIGKTHLQQGLMALTRAVAQPTGF